jgi:competence protein ComEC
MKKLKALLQSEAGSYFYLAVSVFFGMMMTKHLWMIVVYGVLLFRLWKHHKTICKLSVVILLVMGFRALQLTSMYQTGLPSTQKGVVVDKTTDTIVVRHGCTQSSWFLPSPEKYEVGMVVQANLKRKVHDVMNLEHGFHYDMYLISQQSMGSYFASGVEIIDKRFVSESLREAMDSYLQSTFEERVVPYLQYMLLGDNQEITLDIKEAVSMLGIMHLFAISGMHLTLILGAMKWGWNRLFLPTHHFWMIQVLFLLFYNILTGWTISLFRASVLSFLCTSSLAKTYSKIDMVSMVGILMLVYNPYFITRVGFILSFLMTFVLLLLPQKKEQSYLNSTIKLSIAAFCFTLPIISIYQSGVSLFQIPINVLYTLFVVFMFLPMSILTLVFPPLQHIFYVLIQFFEQSTRFVSSHVWMMSFTMNQFEIVIIFYVMLGYLWSKKHSLRQALQLVSLLLFLVLLPLLKIESMYKTRVSVLDINQGDAILIQSFGCNMLIDTGNQDSLHRLQKHLKSINIIHLDALVITHMHQDHYGEAIHLLSTLDIETVYASSPFLHTEKIPQIIPQDGDFIKCGILEFKVWNSHHFSTNENNNSLVLGGLIDGLYWLFMADAEKQVEFELITKKIPPVDILKVGHHGSSTSSTEEFIKFIQPKEAIISVGLYNSFSHPSVEVINRLNQYTNHLYRTDQDGTLLYETYFGGILCIRKQIILQDWTWWDRWKNTQIC